MGSRRCDHAQPAGPGEDLGVGRGAVQPSPFYQNGPNDQGIGWNILSSLARVGIGFGLAAVIGIPLGFMIGRFRFLADMTAPIVSLLRPVSPLAWLPIGLLVFKAANPAAIWVIFISSIWPMIINTAVGVRQVPQDYLNVARVLNLSEWKIFTKILFPAVLPYMLTGIRLSIGVAWLVIVAAEMLTGGVGIGFWVWDEWNNLNVEHIIIAIFVVGIVGLVLEWTLMLRRAALQLRVKPKGHIMKNRYVQIENVGMVFDTKQGPFVALQDIDLDLARRASSSRSSATPAAASRPCSTWSPGCSRPPPATCSAPSARSPGPGRSAAVVFQNHSLLPWLTCFDNVHLAVERVFGATESEGAARASAREHALELVHLAHAAHKQPDEISGGMKQRVGIARALAMEPKVLLLDEPFGALDALTRAHLQDELMRIVVDTGSTVLMVTHDVDEAVLLSDRIVMMTNGPAATIGEILRSTSPRPRDRLALANDAALPPTCAAGCSSSCTRSSCARSRRGEHHAARSDRNVRATAAARGGRQRHGRRAHGRGPARARARALRHHGLRRRAARQLQPHPALAGARRRADRRRHHAERRGLVCGERHYLAPRQAGHPDRPRPAPGRSRRRHRGRVRPAAARDRLDPGHAADPRRRSSRACSPTATSTTPTA